MRQLAFVVGLLISAVGAFGILVPSSLVLIAQHSLSSGAFYLVATVRVAFGLILIAAASTSRMPNTLRVLGYVIVIAGIVTALMGLMAMDHARAMVAWWWRQGPGVVRMTAVLLLALGGFIAYACAPSRPDGPHLGR